MCIYPNASWNNGIPEHTYYTYARTEVIGLDDAGDGAAGAQGLDGAGGGDFFQHFRRLPRSLSLHSMIASEENGITCFNSTPGRYSRHPTHVANPREARSATQPNPLGNCQASAPGRHLTPSRQAAETG
ncbi:hypothetical protein AB0F45_36270 [Streptomyces achromogenes]